VVLPCNQKYTFTTGMETRGSAAYKMPPQLRVPLSSILTSISPYYQMRMSRPPCSGSFGFSEKAFTLTIWIGMRHLGAATRTRDRYKLYLNLTTSIPVAAPSFSSAQKRHDCLIMLLSLPVSFSKSTSQPSMRRSLGSKHESEASMK
jgi:hypothetical protein